jgi:hypothetical protein
MSEIFLAACRTDSAGCIRAGGIGDIGFDFLPIASVVTHLLAPGTDGNQVPECVDCGLGFLKVLE